MSENQQNDLIEPVDQIYPPNDYDEDENNQENQNDNYDEENQNTLNQNNENPQNVVNQNFNSNQQQINGNGNTETDQIQNKQHLELKLKDNRVINKHSPLPHKHRCCNPQNACALCLGDYFNKDCLNLYGGCQPGVHENNILLGVVNSICCGFGLMFAPLCDSPMPKRTLVCAGLFQLLTSFCGVGILMSFCSGLALCCEDSCW